MAARRERERPCHSPSVQRMRISPSPRRSGSLLRCLVAAVVGGCVDGCGRHMGREPAPHAGRTGIESGWRVATNGRVGSLRAGDVERSFGEFADGRGSGGYGDGRSVVQYAVVFFLPINRSVKQRTSASPEVQSRRGETRRLRRRKRLHPPLASRCSYRESRRWWPM